MVALDGSKTASHALDTAIRLAFDRGGRGCKRFMWSASLSSRSKKRRDGDAKKTGPVVSLAQPSPRLHAATFLTSA